MPAAVPRRCSRRAETVGDQHSAARLRREAAEERALADALKIRVAELSIADDARAEWLAHTAVTRDAAQRATAELVVRRAPVGAEADDAVTASEWLAAHTADQPRPTLARHHGRARLRRSRRVAYGSGPVRGRVAGGRDGAGGHPGCCG